MKTIPALLAAALLSAWAWAAEPAVTVEFRAAEPDPAAMLAEMTTPDGTTVYVGEEALLTNADVKSAKVALDAQSKAPVVRLIFTEDGRKKLLDVTTARVGHMIAIVVEGKLLSAPRIMEPIAAGEAVITGNFTRAEAIRIAEGIVPPPPPAPKP